MHKAKTYSLISLKEEMDTIMVGNFNILLSVINRTSRQKTRKYIEESNNTIRLNSSIPLEHFTPKQQNAHSLQMHTNVQQNNP